MASNVLMVTVAEGKQVPITEQSIVLEDGSRVSTLVGKDGQLRETLYEDVTTGYNSFQRAVRLFGQHPFLGQRAGPGK